MLKVPFDIFLTYKFCWLQKSYWNMKFNYILKIILLISNNIYKK